MKHLSLIAIGFLLFSACQQPSSEAPTIDQEELIAAGRQLTDHLLQSPRYMMYETDFLNSIHYAEVCAAYGAIQFARKTGEESLTDSLIARYQALASDSIAWQNHHVDGNVYGILPLEFFQITGDSSYLEHGLYLANTQWQDTLTNGLTSQARYWIDDVYMVCALQVEAYQSTGQKLYLNHAAQLASSYIDSLQQENGLFYHGPNAPIHWGRGNGWMAVGMAAILSDLPLDHDLYAPISVEYKKMMDELLKYQGSNGMWKQIIDLPSAWDESSCTAMFAYALSVGMQRGILEGEAYDQAISKAWQALYSHINDSGELTEVCAGTGQSKDNQYYLDRPRVDGDFHGQAPILWLINSLLEP